MEESVDLILCDPRNRLAGEVRIQLKAVAGRGVEDVQLGTHQPGKGRLARPSESVRLDEAVRLGAGESGGAGHRRATLRAVDTRPRRSKGRDAGHALPPAAPGHPRIVAVGLGDDVAVAPQSLPLSCVLPDGVGHLESARPAPHPLCGLCAPGNLQAVPHTNVCTILE